jgi:hypothetical protein
MSILQIRIFDVIYLIWAIMMWVVGEDAFYEAKFITR